MSKLLMHIGRFAGLIILQVWVLNNISISGYVNPFAYILFIMMLPFGMPGWLLLLSGFGTGLVMDLFMSTPGLHAGAAVFLAFMRPVIVRVVSGSKESENILEPSLSQMGVRWWVSYTIALVFLHHFVLFFLESFSFAQFGGTLLRIVLSTIATSLVILLLSFFFAQKQKR